MVENYSFQELEKLVQASFDGLDWSQNVSVDEMTEIIAEQYFEDVLENDDSQSSNVHPKQLDKEKIKNEISFWITIISFIMAIYSMVDSKPPVTYNTYNNTIEVNNSYTVDMGVDAEFMNRMGYRIINQDNVMPRIKPDCSSTVTGHLYIGQVVNISDKKKKWIDITWKDNEGNYCSGWIQNYKVSGFK